MIKKLVRHGNSLALIIDRPILDILKIDDSTPLELVTDGDLLVVRPHRQDKNHLDLVKEIHNKISERLGPTFKNLAE